MAWRLALGTDRKTDMLRSEYAANQSLAQSVRQPSSWATPSTCVRRKQSAFARALKAVFGRGVL